MMKSISKTNRSQIPKPHPSLHKEALLIKGTLINRYRTKEAFVVVSEETTQKTTLYNT
jgi:hypothetical protein